MKDFSNTERFSTMRRTYSRRSRAEAAGGRRSTRQCWPRWRGGPPAAPGAAPRGSRGWRSRRTGGTRPARAPRARCRSFVEGPGDTVGADVSAEDHRQHVGGVRLLHETHLLNIARFRSGEMIGKPSITLPIAKADESVRRGVTFPYGEPQHEPVRSRKSYPSTSCSRAASFTQQVKTSMAASSSSRGGSEGAIRMLESAGSLP